MKKILVEDIIELIISFNALIILALLSILVVTPLKYIFLFGSIYASINTAKMWENISNYRKNSKKEII